MRGLSAEEVEDLLGLTGCHELSERSQKYYIYYLEPGPVCTESSNKENHALALLIRIYCSWHCQRIFHEKHVTYLKHK